MLIQQDICRDESLRKGHFINQIQMNIVRNAQIRKKLCEGLAIDELAVEYCLAIDNKLAYLLNYLVME
ncbi:hypothetical protein rsdtw13_34040 [Clostridium sp. TW13]|uniref:Uncharacterized protein n=1 Tax=Inconstantimicrobium mannanitabidum TaxID=1604901 RepID=A0ACB5RGC7_9CLOT|nr:hypothetical protein rsdtw13_34040 [Clostridium sp. TW13]